MSDYVRRGLSRLREAVSRFRSAGVLLPAWREVYGEVKTVTFSNILTAYKKDPSCKAFVDFLADQVVGMGFYTSSATDEEYAQASKAKEVVDDFCEHVNLDGLLQIGAREIVASGNNFWLKIEPQSLENLKILPLTGFDDFKAVARDASGEVIGYNYSFGGVKKTFPPEKIIHWKWEPVNFSAFGTGVLQVLLEELSFNGEKRMSFLEMKARIENMMPKIFEKYGGPDELWHLPSAKAEDVNKLQSLLRSKPKEGARFVWSGKQEAKVSAVMVDPRARYEAYIAHIMGQINMGGQSPLSSLMISPNYLTKATAEAAMDLLERKVMSLQRFMKRIVEREIFTAVVKQAGLDPVKAAVRLNWGLPEKPEIEALLPVLAQIATTRPDVISTAEFRDILIDMGLPLEKAEPEQPETAEEATRFLEGPDWCGDAGGDWITVDGKHICIDIQDFDKVPSEIRGVVGKTTAQAAVKATLPSYYAKMLDWQRDGDFIKAVPNRELSDAAHKTISKTFKRLGGKFVSYRGQTYFELPLDKLKGWKKVED